MDHFICGFFGFWWWVKIFKKQIVEKKKMFLESFFWLCETIILFGRNNQSFFLHD